MTESLRLFGSPISSYYNKIKIALIELQLPVEEVPWLPGAGQWPESGSPSGKIPFLLAGGQAIYESQAIIEYLEDSNKSTQLSLFPADALQRAHCRELIQYIELYLDGPARAIYPAAFWGKKMEPAILDQTLQQLEHGLVILRRRGDLDQWLCGTQFSHADAAAWVHLSTIRWALSIIGKKDFLQTRLPDLGNYLERLSERPSIQQVEADRREASRALKEQRAATAAKS